MAVNCFVRPAAIEGSTGVKLIDLSSNAVTVKTATLLVTPLKFAVILVEPAARLVAKPVALMVATVILELVQVTLALKLAVEVSE